MSLKNSNKFRLGRHLFYYLTTWIWVFGEEDHEAYKTLSLVLPVFFPLSFYLRFDSLSHRLIIQRESSALFGNRKSYNPQLYLPLLKHHLVHRQITAAEPQ